MFTAITRMSVAAYLVVAAGLPSVACAEPSLTEQLATIETGLAQTRATGSQDTAPSRLDSQFIGLYGRVIAHDGRPTEPEQARFRDIDPLLTKLQGAMDVVIRTTLPAVNKLLTSRRVPAIVVR